MSRKEVFVIRIGISLESVADAHVEATLGESSPSATANDQTAGCRTLGQTERRDERPPRFHGRDNRPTEAYVGDRRAMSDAQKKALFRLVYTLGDREGALTRVLEALGVERLEWATRADASRAIDTLRGKSSNGSGRPSNGAGHA